MIRDWDPAFCARSPMFAPLEPCAAALRGPAWPVRAAVQSQLDAGRVRTSRGLPLTLTDSGTAEGGYETRIHRHGEMAYRAENWHDLFNVLTWIRFPAAKAAINARHAAEIACSRPGSARGPVRDALTLFDESGVAVVSSDPALLDLIRGFRWKELFWAHRARVREAMRFVLFGHALYEKALAPYVGLTGHALLLEMPCGFGGVATNEFYPGLDAAIASRIADGRSFRSSADLAPLPLLGVPDWWPDGECAGFYDNASYFRSGRGRRGARPGRP